MKKLLVLTVISSLITLPHLQIISLVEYMQQNGTPVVDESGTLDLEDRNLTDLTGLQNINDKDRVTTLRLADNQLTTLPANILNGFNNLRILYLQDNQLTTLPTDIFRDLTKLRDLHLQNNQLTTLPAGIFNGLNNLQRLFLSNNKLTTLPADIFNTLNNLRFLYLQNNQLTTLPTYIFRDLTNLKSLNLNNNQLLMLPTDIFNNLPNLRTLDLKGNLFAASFMPDLIEMLHNIPNDLIQIRLFTWPDMSKEEAIKQLVRNTAPHLLRKLSSNIREYYNIDV